MLNLEMVLNISIAGVFRLNKFKIIYKQITNVTDCFSDMFICIYFRFHLLHSKRGNHDIENKFKDNFYITVKCVISS